MWGEVQYSYKWYVRVNSERRAGLGLWLWDEFKRRKPSSYHIHPGWTGGPLQLDYEKPHDSIFP